ncbi:MAG: DUF4403 family protein [Bacteroidia bacterium]|nr:DUF4403 family protein [Bacteroidia bacterium]
MLIPIVLPLQLLEKAIQDRFNDVSEWMDGEESAPAFTEIDVEIEDKIKLSAHNGRLISRIPILVRAKLKRNSRFLPNIPSLENISMSLMVFLDTSLLLNKDWKLQASSASSYEWREEPAWGGGLLKLPVKSFIEPVIEKELAGVAKQIDQLIEKEVDLTDLLWESWHVLKNQIQIDTDWGRPLYVELNLPDREVNASPIKVEDKEIRLLMELAFAQDRVVASGLRVEETKPKTLPSYTSRIMVQSDEAVQLDVLFSKDDLEFILDQMTFPLDVHSFLEIKDSSIQLSKSEVSGLDVALKTSLSGRSRPFRIKGMVLVKGKIEWIPEEQQFVVEDFAYQLLSGNLPLRLVNLFRRNSLSKELQQSVREELNRQWDIAKMAIRDALIKFRVNEYALLETEGLVVRMNAVNEKDGGIELGLVLSGKPKLSVTKLDF